MNLNLDTLKETYSWKGLQEISKKCKKIFIIKLNNNIDNKIKNDIIIVKKNKLKES